MNTIVTTRPGRSIRRILTSSLVAMAASAALSSTAFAGTGDIVIAPNDPPPPNVPGDIAQPESQPDPQPDPELIPACVLFDPDLFVYDHEINGTEVTVFPSYSDGVDTCEETLLIRTWTLPFHNALEWEPGAAVFAEDKVSLSAVEAATEQGQPLGVTLPTPECHTQTEVIIGDIDMGGYKWSNDCTPDEIAHPGDQPNGDPQEGDPQEGEPQEGELPHTGTTTAPMIGIAMVLAGLGLGASVVARRRPATVR